MLAVPVATPVTTPVAPSTEAMAGSLLLQVPPVTVALNVVVVPTQAVVVPVIIPAVVAGVMVRVSVVVVTPQVPVMV